MGEGRARRVFMSARVFGAGELPDLGLASRVVAPADLDAAVEAEVAPYLACAARRRRRAKRLARDLGPRIDAAVIEDTITRLADTWERRKRRRASPPSSTASPRRGRVDGTSPRPASGSRTLPWNGAKKASCCRSARRQAAAIIEVMTEARGRHAGIVRAAPRGA